MEKEEFRSRKVKTKLNRIRKEIGEPIKVFSSLLRLMITSSPDHELFCADFSAVELCLTFWVADHTEGLKAIREGRKLYEEMASAAFGIPLKDVTKESLERFVGKESVLGCGYGMGHVKFLSQCHKKGMKSVTPEIAKKAVDAYRSVHYPVPDLWRALEWAAIKAIQSPGTRIKTNRVTVYTHGDFLCIKLPSGRRLRYFKPRLASKRLASGRLVPEIHYMAPWKGKLLSNTLWGGVLTNHVVQGIARDLLVNGIFNIKNAGYKFLLSIHDEALAERKVGEGSLPEYLKLMNKIPAWAKGAPITSAGWGHEQRYRK